MFLSHVISRSSKTPEMWFGYLENFFFFPLVLAHLYVFELRCQESRDIPKT